jgi:pimeloyl-ACP methyl ester carboxylesterase
MPKLILIPGLGANRLLFEPQRHALDQTLFLPDWQPPMSTQVEGKKPVPESLRDYARRWADRWVQTVLSKPEVREQFWVGGVSFGGMIALEAAARLIEEGCPPKGVFLIASCRSADSLSMRFKLQQRLGAMIPAGKAPAVIKFLAATIAKKEGLSDLDAHLLKKISADTDINMLQWGGRACIQWTHTEADAKALQRAGVSIHQVHGDADWVIAMTKGHTDKVIRGGKHLINITHADEINQYLIARMKADLAGE